MSYGTLACPECGSKLSPWLDGTQIGWICTNKRCGFTADSTKGLKYHHEQDPEPR